MRQVVRIDTDGLRWAALRVSPSLPSHPQEFSTADELTARGMVGYCPTGAKLAIWETRTRRASKGTIRQYPVFSRYVFVGLFPGQSVGRNSRIGIEAVLGDSQGPLFVPPAAIRRVNDLELAGEWDSTRDWRDKSAFHPGDNVRIIEGAFEGFPATVSSLESEASIWVLINVFGRATRSIMPSCQIASV